MLVIDARDIFMSTDSLVKNMTDSLLNPQNRIGHKSIKLAAVSRDFSGLIRYKQMLFLAGQEN